MVEECLLRGLPLKLSCPICESQATVEFLTRPAVPAHQNLLLADSESAQAIARGKLALRVCRACGFVFNDAFDPGLLSYGAAYDNTQTYSPAFNEYVEALVEDIATRTASSCRRVVEVGCGKGHFLTKLMHRLGPGHQGHGFDPTYVGPERQLDGRLTFHRTFYDEAAAHLAADVVVCRHVIEHVEDPVSLLRSVRRALGDASGARVYFETPDVTWILRHRVVWDLFYEHCSLFTAGSLTAAFRRAGFVVDAVRRVFGEQYLWLEARPGKADPVESGDAAEAVGLAQEYGALERDLIARWQQRLRQHALAGKVAVWGAGAKGVTFCNLADPDGRLVDCVVDLNPAKQGRSIAGTGHPIVAPAQLPQRGVRVALVLNPNYHSEIATDLSQRGWDVSVVDVMASW